MPLIEELPEESAKPDNVTDMPKVVEIQIEKTPEMVTPVTTNTTESITETENSIDNSPQLTQTEELNENQSEDSKDTNGNMEGELHIGGPIYPYTYLHRILIVAGGKHTIKWKMHVRDH